MSAHAFLLSPARLDGMRGKRLLNPRSQGTMARALRQPEGVALGEVYTFLSSLYFRGKLTYAKAFAPRVLLITTHRGLVAPDQTVRRKDLVDASRIDLATGDRRFLTPLVRDARALDGELGPDANVVLLGSIATGKYVDPLLAVFGERLLFPTSFVGRGDMSRGGLLLRSAKSGDELEYAPVHGAVRHGVRPPKLAPLR
jgi:hypothetical protein